MTNQFRQIMVRGFRRLLDVDVELYPITVVVGANGAGKSSLLDAVSLLSRSAQGALNSTIGDYFGLPASLTFDRAADLSLGISMGVSDHQPLNYTLRVRPQGGAYVITDESLSQQRFADRPPFRHIDSHGPDVKFFEVDQNKLVRPTWEYNSLESSLSQVTKMFEEPELFRSRLASSVYYRGLNVQPGAPVRMAQPMRPATLPGANGEDLVSCLFYLRETERRRFEAIEEALKEAFPRFQRLEFPPVAAGTLGLAWRETSFTQPVYTHQLSEGILRFLWLATLLQSSGLPALTLLDEPETSLHPELLSLLAELMHEASTRTQLVVATHSDRLIRFLKLPNMLVMDELDDGTSQVQSTGGADLEEWLDDYCMDDLWDTGPVETADK
ncbi:MAG: AAA family ATPase [Capsulimonadaceae bacterium]